MLGLVALLLLLPFLSCKEKVEPTPNPLDASRIEGRWVDMTGTLFPDWHYHFDQGLINQQYEQAGAVLADLTYPYATRKDSVFIGGDATNPPRTWVLNFECEEIVEVRQVGVAIGARFWLRRE